MWGEHTQIRAGCVLGAWLLAWGLDKWAWATTSKDEESGRVVIQRQEEQVCSHTAFKALL